MNDEPIGRDAAAWPQDLAWADARVVAAAPAQRTLAIERGTLGPDMLDGTDGDDSLYGDQGDDMLQGYAGNDLIDGGLGKDTAFYYDAWSGVQVDLAAGTATGGSGNDRLVSIEDVWGSYFDDTLSGTAGDNSLTGDLGNDRLSGRGGSDWLEGGDGDDHLDGGEGNDIVSHFLDAHPVTVDLAAGTATSVAGRDTLVSIEDAIGSLHDDTLIGDAGMNLLVGLLGDDQIDGGGSLDWAGYWLTPLAEATVRYDPITGWLSVATDFEGTDLLRGIEFIQFGDLEVAVTEFMPAAAPVALDFNPLRGSADARVGTDLVITYNTPVQRGQGTIVLRDGTGAVAATFDVATSTALQFEGHNLRVDPPQNLRRATTYTLEVPAGAVIDPDGQTNIADNSYRFTTRQQAEVSLPERSLALESSGQLQVAVQLSEASSQPVQVTVQVLAEGTAGAGVDMALVTRVASFEPGQTVATVSVPLQDDATLEPSESFTLQLSAPVGAVLGEDTGLGVIVDDDDRWHELPTDPLVGEQWHLFPSIGANVLGLWDDYSGAGVRVGVFDQGIDAGHPDLAGRVAVGLGRDTATLAAGGAPRTAWDNHGTAVAGVIGAARNGVGTVGVAHGADLVSLYSPLDTDSPLGEIRNAFEYALTLDVLNNSWGFAPQYYLDAPWAFYDNFADPEFAAIGQALGALADDGRDGLGTIVVQSAGNSFAYGDDTNLHSFQNSRYIVTVAATDYTGAASSYSSPGASILVAAPGGDGSGSSSDILTTDRAGRWGYMSGDHVNIAGTSFSAPVVSGIVALMLQANPALGWRDVQRLLAFGAQRSAEQDNDWRHNGATGWNGGGLHYDALDHDLGFGLVDAHAAVRLAESWQAPAATSANLVQVQVGRTAPAPIPDGAGSLTQSVHVGETIDVERAEVTVDIDHGYLGDLSLQLVSPSGTESWLLSRPGVNALSPYGVDQANLQFTFSTVLSLGESSFGTWSLTVFDEELPDAGTLKSWTLTLTGSAASPDDTHVYTDEFGETVAGNAARARLADGGGTDTLNAAAITSDSVIDLTPGGSASRLDGRTLEIADGTLIEHAWGGDGDDQLRGNDAANQLHGMRGNDVLAGGGGADLLDGGAGVDTVRADGARGQHRLEHDGPVWLLADVAGATTDELRSVERIHFDDAALALDLAPGEAGFLVAAALRALLGPQALQRSDLAGIGLALLDGGMGFETLVAEALQTSVFRAAVGSGSDADFVRLVYRNVVGTAPDAAALAAYTGLLGDGGMTQAELAVAACLASINTGSIELTGLADTGLVYLPFAG